MRLISGALCLVIGLAMALPAAAVTVYKGRDKNGNIILSDSPFPGATPMEVQGVQTMPLPKASESKRPVKEASEREEVGSERYTLTIASPTEGQVFRKGDVESVPVGVSVTPEPKRSHSVVVLVDGREFGEEGEAVSIPMSELERGSHMVAAEVRDKAGKVVGQARAVTFHVEQTTVYNRANSGTVPKAPSAPRTGK